MYTDHYTCMLFISHGFEVFSAFGFIALAKKYFLTIRLIKNGQVKVLVSHLEFRFNSDFTLMSVFTVLRPCRSYVFVSTFKKVVTSFRVGCSHFGFLGEIMAHNIE